MTLPTIIVIIMMVRIMTAAIDILANQSPIFSFVFGLSFIVGSPLISGI